MVVYGVLRPRERRCIVLRRVVAGVCKVGWYCCWIEGARSRTCLLVPSSLPRRVFAVALLRWPVVIYVFLEAFLSDIEGGGGDRTREGRR